MTSHQDGASAAPLLPPGALLPAPLRWLARLVDWAIVAIGGVMATLIFANVVAHNLFRADLAATTEFCELLMVWVTFLGGAAATRRGAHMAIGELVERLTGAGRRAVEAGIQVLVLGTLSLLVWHGAGIAQTGMLSVLTVLGWPMAVQYSALPVASAITMVFVGWDLYQILLGRTYEQRYGQQTP
jgi:TRAP-type C4-dicarboxylate transport system permease small subunit